MRSPVEHTNGLEAINGALYGGLPKWRGLRFKLCLGVPGRSLAFPKFRGLDEGSTSWDLKIRILRKKLHI